jgi:hypothetical protein
MPPLRFFKKGKKGKTPAKKPVAKTMEKKPNEVPRLKIRRRMKKSIEERAQHWVEVKARLFMLEREIPTKMVIDELNELGERMGIEPLEYPPEGDPLKAKEHISKILRRLTHIYCNELTPDEVAYFHKTKAALWQRQ